MEFEKVIGVTMEPSETILRDGFSYKDAANTIAKHLIKSRGTASPVWKPYIMQKGVSYSGSCRNIAFDGYSFYPDAKVGDAVYTECNIEIEKDYELWINTIGITEVFLNGEKLISSWSEAAESEENNSYVCRSVKLEKSKLHNLVIKTVCTEKSFGYKLNIAPPRCPSLWASFYLVMARTMLPINPLKKEEGIAVSPLYTGAKSAKEAYETDYAFMENKVYSFPKSEKEDLIYDFEKIYGEGKSAFAYTNAESNGYVEIKANSFTKIIINSEKIATLKKGEKKKFSTKSADVVLIKSVRENDGWGFEITDKSGVGMSFLDTDRAENFSFAICGPFYQKGSEALLPIEYADNLLKPFPDGNGKKVFWRFKKAYLRAYLLSSFAGQWYYATMLSYKGIKDCGEALDNPDYIEYFMNNQSFLADWYDYALYDNEKFGHASFMCSVGDGSLLDHIGTMGVNFIDAYQRTGDERFRYIIKTLQYQIRNNVTRFDDGTFNRSRHNTMWADDFYMSCPFLARLYARMGDEESLEDIVKQTLGFVKKLYMPNEKIFSHIYFLDKAVKNSVPWGRGNGWIALGMSEILLHLPKENPAFEIVRSAFADFCEGIAALQDECGLYHQVLNRPQSYLETSCTAMFALAMYRGVQNGWISDKFIKNADKGLEAILKFCVDKDGVVYGVCMGSSCSMDEKYYFDLTTIKDDNHGTGIVLTLLCEKIGEVKKSQRVDKPIDTLAGVEKGR